MDKQIRKLLEKAEIEKELDTSEINAIETTKEDFIKLKGKLIYAEDEDCFYKFTDNKWFKFKQKPSSIRVELNDLYNTCQQSEELLENRIEALEQRIREIQVLQQTFFDDLKEYVDLKIKASKKEKKPKNEKKV